MNTNKLSKKDIFLIFVVVAVAAISVYRLVAAIRLGLVTNADHVWIWYDANLAWRHLDVYKEIAENTHYDGFVVHSEVSAFPWGLIFNIFLHGGFLSADGSIWWYRMMRLIFYVLMCACVYRKMSKLGVENWKKYLAMLVFLAPWSNISCLTAGNQGQVLVMWIVIAICIIDENEYVAAIFMTLAMIKPQIALPFFALFLLKKKWKIIITSVVAVLATWLICALWTHANPIDQMIGAFVLSGDLYWDIHVVGICDFLRHFFGVSDRISMVASMVVGIAAMTVMIVCVLKDRLLNEFQLYSIPAIVSIFWCYKSECDYIIVIIAGLAILTMWDGWKQRWKDTFTYLCVFVMLFTKPFSQALLGGWLHMSMYTSYVLDLYMKVAALVLLTILYRKNCLSITKNES